VIGQRGFDVMSEMEKVGISVDDDAAKSVTLF
jgi:hypothetical protein